MCAQLEALFSTIRVYLSSRFANPFIMHCSLLYSESYFIREFKRQDIIQHCTAP